LNDLLAAPVTSLAGLRHEEAECRRCDLYHNATQVVPGEGAARQIEALRQLEIPEGMQQAHGFAPLGAADGEVKEAILGRNGEGVWHAGAGQACRRQAGWRGLRIDYFGGGKRPSHLAYGYVRRA
jgi:hypothetical protein